MLYLTKNCKVLGWRKELERARHRTSGCRSARKPATNFLFFIRSSYTRSALCCSRPQLHQSYPKSRECIAGDVEASALHVVEEIPKHVAVEDDSGKGFVLDALPQDGPAVVGNIGVVLVMFHEDPQGVGGVPAAPLGSLVAEVFNDGVYGRCVLLLREVGRGLRAVAKKAAKESSYILFRLRGGGWRGGGFALTTVLEG